MPAMYRTTSWTQESNGKGTLSGHSTFHENCTQPSYIIENGLYAGTEGIQLALATQKSLSRKSTSLSKNNRPR